MCSQELDIMKFKRQIIPYDPALKEKARQLRNNSTKSEILLWQFLKGKQMLAIEIDGESHFGKEKYDENKQKQLEDLGVRFLRFEDADVFYNLEEVLNKIEKWIKEKSRTR